MKFIVQLGLFTCVGNRIFCFKLLKRLDTSMTSNDTFRKMITAAKSENHDPIMISHDDAMIPSCKPSSLQAINQESKKEKPQAPKEPKKTYGEFENVMLTDKEYNDKLLAVFGEKQTKAIIEKLSQTKATNKKLKYDSDMAAIRKWVIEAVGAKPLPPVTPYVPFLYKIGKPAEAKT